MPFLDLSMLKRVARESVKVDAAELKVGPHPMLALRDVPSETRITYLQGCVLAAILNTGDIDVTSKANLVRLGKSLGLELKDVNDCILATAKVGDDEQAKEKIVRVLVEVLAGDFFPKFFMHDFEAFLPKVGGELTDEMIECLDYFGMALTGCEDWRCVNDYCNEVEAAENVVQEGCLEEMSVAFEKEGQADFMLELNGRPGFAMEMCWLSPGSFKMGSPADEDEHFDDESLCFVRLTKGFWIGRYEVTQRQWKGVMGKNPSYFKGDDLPVENVSWYDCQEFIQRINASLIGTGLRISLPTEAQWEYACRAGTTTPFHFGSELNGVAANCDGRSPYGVELNGIYRGKTMPVGSYAPNEWGLFDMHGNVLEWCEDWYGQYEEVFMDDPTGARQGEKRVVRGGSWLYGAHRCRSACRDGYEPNMRDASIGLRLVGYSV